MFNCKKRLGKYALIILGLLIIFSSTSLAGNDVNQSIVSHYTADNTKTSGTLAIDSNAKFNASIYTVTTAITGYAGKIGESYYLISSKTPASTGSKVQTSIPVETTGKYGNNWTSCAWVNWSQNTANYDGVMGDVTGSNGIAVGLDSDSSVRLYTGAWTDSNFIIALNAWHYVCLVNFWNGTTGNQSIFINGTLRLTHSGTYTNSTLNWTFGNMYANDANMNEGINGTIDLMTVWNRSLNQDNLTFLFNNGNGIDYPFFVGEGTNFSVTATDEYNGSALNISVWVNGTFQYTNTTVTTNVLTNASTTYNITIGAAGYNNRTYANTNVSTNLDGKLFKTYRFYSSTFSGYVNFNQINYTRNLTWSNNITCPDWDNAVNISTFINNTLVNTKAVTCNNNSQLVTGNYSFSTEGSYNFSFLLNSSAYTENSDARNFTWDTEAPGAFGNFSRQNGFNNFTTNVTSLCYDNIFPNLNYTVTFNGASMFSQNFTNNTYKYNSSFLVFGANVVNVTCRDPWSNTTFTDSENVYASTLCLIDERDNTYFNASNISDARVYFDDNSTYFAFRVNNSYSHYCTNFTGIGTEKLRFELTYASGDIITRYVDVTLFNNSAVRVCANKEGTTHYEQLILSGSIRPVFLKSVFSNCVIAADYTRFAYQDSYLLKAYSIATMYYLYTYDQGQQVLLASVDGTVSTYMNVDTLEFAQNEYNLNAYGQGLGIEKITSSEVQISYVNINSNNANASIKISDVSTGTTYLSTSVATPNNFTVYFDWTTLSVTNNSLFVVEVTTTDTDGNVNVIKQYLNTQATRGQLSAGVSFVIALLLTVFGLTMVASRYALGWFGMAVLIGSIAVLAVGVWEWYVLMLMAIDVILLIFTIIVFVNQNYITVS